MRSCIHCAVSIAFTKHGQKGQLSISLRRHGKVDIFEYAAAYLLCLFNV